MKIGKLIDNVGFMFACLILIGMIVYFPLLALNCSIAVRTTTHEYVSTFHPIYHATAPFGLIWVETNARGTFLFIAGSYSLNTQLSEEYIVKYMDENSLLTLMLDAEDIPVIVDGTFRLEVIRKYTRQKQLFKNIEQEDKFYYPKYKIHIPELPNLNETISKEWMFVGS